MRQFDRYIVSECLRAGRGALVYRAYDERLLSEISLKLLGVDVAVEPGALSIFRREMLLARRVHHPNLAHIYEFGCRDGQAFVATEMVEGQTLAEVIESECVEGRCLDESEVLGIVGQLASALSAAHQLDVIHRDVRPANIIRGPEGRMVLTGLGLARVFGKCEAPSSGTWDAWKYAAPEQLRGGEISTRCDCYSLGLVAYELATGRLPFEQEGADHIMARLKHPAPDPRDHRADLSSSSAALIRRCLEPEPADRWQSMKELALWIGERYEPRPQGQQRSVVPDIRRRNPRATRIAVSRLEATGTDLVSLGAEFSEELIEELFVYPLLDVPSYFESDPRQSESPANWGRELGADYVLHGGLSETPGGVRLRLELTSCSDDSSVWSQCHDCSEDELLQLSSSISREVAVALSRHARPQRVHPSLSSDPWALELLLRAQAGCQSFDPVELAEAERSIIEARKVQPDCGIVLATASLIASRKWMLDREPQLESLMEARSLANQAVVRFGQLGEAHLALGVCDYLAGASLDAARSLRIATGCSPQLAEVHELLGILLLEAGLVELGMERLSTARRLNPGLRLSIGAQARVQALLGNQEELELLMARGKGMTDRVSDLWLPAARYATWSHDEVRAELVRAEISSLHVRPDEEELAWFVGALLEVHFEGKPADRVLEYISETSRRPSADPRSASFMLELFAETSAACWDSDAALEAIELRSRLELGGKLWLQKCPLLESLRREPAFELAILAAARDSDRLVDEIWGRGSFDAE